MIILKGILLWSTCFAFAIVLCGLESLIETIGFYTLLPIAGIILAAYACKLCITKEEFEVLSLQKLFNVNSNED